jgi:hypothetical protein
MATNPIIYATDYNGIQTKVQTVLGTYYGQSVNSSAISTPVTNQNATNITALQWQKLYTDLLICYNHQNASNGSLTYPTTTTVIALADLTAYQNMGTSILSNYLQFNSGYKSSQSFTSQTVGPGWGINNSSNTVKHTLVLTFPNAASAGYFFNSGGSILFSASMSGGQTAVAGTKDFSWNSMLSHMGVIQFSAGGCTTQAGALTPGTGYLGFYSLTASNQLVYQKLTENATYSPNQLDIYANFSGSTLSFAIEYEDRSGPSDGIHNQYNVDEAVTGTLTSNASMSYASGGPTGFTMNVTSYLPTASTNSVAVIASPSP